MENKINIAELLRNCPDGMELDCTMYENCTFDGLEDFDGLKESHYPIKVQTPDGRMALNKYGCYSTNEYSKCVIFPKGKTTWEGFQRPFKDGDVLTNKYGNTFIYKGLLYKNPTLTDFYCGYRKSDKVFILKSLKDEHFGDISECHLATKKEKQKLFDAIKANGYKWNSETKTLEKLINPKFEEGDEIEKCGYRFTITEVKDDYYLTKCGNKIPIDYQDDFSLVPNKFDISTLKPFDTVLIRDKDTDEWNCHFFSYYKNSDRPYICIGCEGLNEYKQCIPYEENKHLIGTTDDCDEYFKIWR